LTEGSLGRLGSEVYTTGSDVLEFLWYGLILGIGVDLRASHGFDLGGDTNCLLLEPALERKGFSDTTIIQAKNSILYAVQYNKKARINHYLTSTNSVHV
jgi:hypothetical protein